MAIDARMTLTHRDALGRPFGVDGIKKALDASRMDAAILTSAMAVDVDIRQGNAYLAEAIKDEPRLFGCLVVSPAYPDESVEIMRAMMSRSKFVALGIFKGVSKPYPNIDDCREIINSYRRFTKPILLHTPDAESVDAAVEIAQEFPGIRFILGSMGGADWRRAIPHAKQLNLILDTSGSFDAEKIEMAVSEFGDHRVIFGSDYPSSDLPPMLALIQSSGIAKRDMAKVLGENAKALFGLAQSTMTPDGE